VSTALAGTTKSRRANYVRSSVGRFARSAGASRTPVTSIRQAALDSGQSSRKGSPGRAEVYLSREVQGWRVHERSVTKLGPIAKSETAERHPARRGALGRGELLDRLDPSLVGLHRSAGRAQRGRPARKLFTTEARNVPRVILPCHCRPVRRSAQGRRKPNASFSTERQALPARVAGPRSESRFGADGDRLAELGAADGVSRPSARPKWPATLPAAIRSFHARRHRLDGDFRLDRRAGEKIDAVRAEASQHRRPL